MAEDSGNQTAMDKQWHHDRHKGETRQIGHIAEKAHIMSPVEHGEPIASQPDSPQSG